MRERLDEVVDAAGAAGALQRLVRNAGPVVDKILADRALKHPGILQDHAEQAVHRLAAHILCGDTVDADVASVQIIEAHEQIDHRRLSGAGRTDDGDLLPRRNMGREIMDDRLLRVIGVAEADVVKLDLTAHRLRHGQILRLIRQLRLLQEIKHAVARRGGGLQLRHALRDRRQRRGEQAHIEDEGRDDAELDAAVHHERSAQHAHGDIAEVADDVHQRLHDAGKELALAVCLIDGAVHAAERLLDPVIRARNAHDVMAGIHLFNIAVQRAEALLPVDKVFLRALHDDEHEHKADHCRRDGSQRHAPLRHEHHDDAARKLGHGADHGRQTVGQGLLQRTDIVCHAAEDIAVRDAVEAAHGHAVDLGAQVAAHLLREAERHGRHDIVLDIGQQGTERIDAEQHARHAANGRKVDLPHQRIGDQICDLAELIRPEDRQHRARGREHQRDQHRELDPLGIGEQLTLHAAQAALALLGRAHAAPAHRSHCHQTPSFSSSAAESCDMAISRYTLQFFISSSCVPIPATRPSSSTTMRSAWRIVPMRCATIRQVVSLSSRARPARRLASVR